MQMTNHATVMARQRGIPYDCIEIIMQFGTPEEKPGKAFEYRLTKRDMQKAANHLKHMIQLIDKAAHKAVLVSGDVDHIITVYNCTRASKNGPKEPDSLPGF